MDRTDELEQRLAALEKRCARYEAALYYLADWLDRQQQEPDGLGLRLELP